MAGAALARAGAFLRGCYQDLAGAGKLVLEAGGGSFTHFPLPPAADLVALDISRDQLRTNASTPLKVCADLQKLPLAPQSIDVVFCFNVIEHLDRPAVALERLCEALRAGGMLVLGFPERDSLKGLVTRASPLAFHRWYYRRVVGKRDRGEGHFDAFPTVFRPLVSSSALARWLPERDMELIYVDRYDGARDYEIVSGGLLRRAFALPYYALSALAWCVTLGRWQPAISDALIVARKGRRTSVAAPAADNR